MALFTSSSAPSVHPRSRDLLITRSIWVVVALGLDLLSHHLELIILVAGCLRVASLLAMVLVAPWKWCWVGSIPSLPSWVGSRPSSSSLEPGIMPGSLLVLPLFLVAPRP